MIKHGKDHFVNENKEKSRLALLRSQNILREVSNVSQEYAQVLVDYLGEEQAQLAINQLKEDPKLSLDSTLSSRRMDSVLKMITQLQSEEKQVQDAKTVISNLRSTIEIGAEPQPEGEVPGLQTQESGKDWKKNLENHKDTLAQTFNYLRINRSVDDFKESQFTQEEAQSVYGQDPIQQLQSLSQRELAYSYDTLLTQLEIRERLIKTRI